MEAAGKPDRKGWRAVLFRWLIIALVMIAGGYHVFRMPGRSHDGPLRPLTAEESALRDRLRSHVRTLAGEIGERHVWRHRALDRAAGYLEGELRGAGYAVADQAYTAEGREVRNLEAELRGSSAPEEIIVVGAHYDSVSGSPGANDNASGVAALIEIAHSLAGWPLPRTVRFVLFTNEEPPFFKTGQMGSLVYARRARLRGERIVAMLSLETIGYYADAPGSQHYPFPLNFFYPSKGNFIGFVGNIGSRRLVRRALATFRGSTAFPSEGAAVPGGIIGVDWSDHWSFWHEGYPALMVTDTALFRYHHYHGPRDTPERLDYGRMARVTAGLARVVAELAQR
ncbi:MAG: M28 family peptidase [Geobacteraceae bacterium]|nr:M28 family peptidase [Geobacteraceae bacterium]